MPQTKFIAVLNANATPHPKALEALTGVIEMQSKAELISAKDDAVLFSGEPTVVAQLAELFSEHLLIEEDKNIALQVPGPVSNGNAISNALGTDDDDKDPNEVVHF